MPENKSPLDHLLSRVDLVIAEHEQQVAVVEEILPPEIRVNGAEYWARMKQAHSRTLSAFDLPEHLVGEPASASTP
jgi:hypothetical protein